MKAIHVDATTLPDAWFQTVYKCLEYGNIFKIDRGSYAGDKRLEFDYITIQIKSPDKGDLIPHLPAHYNLPDPVELEYILSGTDKNDITYERGYVEYLMSGEVQEGESYTYGERLNNYRLMHGQTSRWNQKQLQGIYYQDKEIWNTRQIIFNTNGSDFLSQIELVIWTYKKKGHRNNQMCLQVAKPEDMLLQDPPCLRHIDTRIQDDTLHFFPYFRSWDLWGGLPANLAGIELLKQYMASEIGVKNGQIIAASKGLHLYSYVWELAEILRGRTIEEFKTGI